MEPPRARQRETSGPHPAAHLQTPRLRLDAVVPGDLDEHYALLSDPAVWAHSPEGRHTSPERTTEAIAHAVGHWERDGLAAELVDAALAAARRVDRDLPLVALLLEPDVHSRGRAERAGLSLVRRGPDAGNPDPSAVRLVFADRPLADDLLARVTAHP